MSPCLLDHLAVVAPTLEAGAAFVHEALGVAPQSGGEHPRMGTHNRLLRLGESSYLEVIAVNPAMPTPDRPRWFALDRLSPHSAPRLACWVARASSIHDSTAACSEPLGAIEAMSRGGLSWLITIPQDGSLPLDGIAPAVIQWQAMEHPAAALADHGLSLSKLELFHPEPRRIARLLQSLSLAGPVSVASLPPGSAPRLVAHIQTPQGLRRL